MVEMYNLSTQCLILGDINLAAIKQQALFCVPIHQVILEACKPKAFKFTKGLCHFLLSLPTLADTPKQSLLWYY